MNLIKYLCSKKYRDIFTEEYTCNIVKAINEEQIELERIYSFNPKSNSENMDIRISA